MLEEIMKLTPDEILILNGLVDVAREAKTAAKIIQNAFQNSFGIGVDKIEVWHDDYNAEYLTHDGVWQARYLHQTYDVKCTAEEIFKFFRADYLISNGYEKEFNGNYRTEAGEKKEVCGYFRCFVKNIQK